MAKRMNQLLDLLAFYATRNRIPIWAFTLNSIAMWLLLSLISLWLGRPLPLMLMALPVLAAAYSWRERWIFGMLIGLTGASGLIIWWMLNKASDLPAIVLVTLLIALLGEITYRNGNRNLDLERDRNQRQSVLSLLTRLTSVLGDVKYPAEAYAAGVNHLAYVLTDATIALYVKRGGVLVREHAANADDAPVSQSIHTGLMGDSARARQPMTLTEATADDYFKIAAPVLANASVVAMLLMGNPRDRSSQETIEQDLALLSIVASEIGLAVERVRDDVGQESGNDGISLQAELQANLDQLMRNVTALTDRCSGTPYADVSEAVHVSAGQLRESLQRAAMVADPR